MPEFPPVTHVAVTVSDLERSRAWYAKLFGSDPVLDENAGAFHHVVWLLGSTLFGIHEHPSLTSTSPFDERRPGLDHVAFACSTRSELEEWSSKLDELGIEVVVAVGDEARLYLSGRDDGIAVPDAGAFDPIAAVLRPGDAILVKGSRSVGLEGIPGLIQKHSLGW